MSSNKFLINFFKPTKKKKQVATLFSVNIIGIPIGIVSNLIVTRYLGAESYGDLSFIMNIFNVSIILFTFGLYQAGNRALVLNNDPNKAKELYGAEIFYTVLIFIAMSIALIGYAKFDTNIIEKGLQKILLLSIPFGWIFLFRKYFEALFQADNKISELAFARLMPKFVYLIGALGLFLFAKNITTTRLQIVWSIRLLSYFLIYFPIFLWIRPKFTNIKERIREIWTYNRSFGFPMYSGSLFSVGLNALTGVLISYFSIDNVGVGFFGLALILSQPLSFIPNVIATTHYKDFSKQNEIPRKLIVVTIGMCFVALIVLRMLIAPFITFFYSEEFIPVINLSFIVSIGVLLYGFADFFNRFLGAHGKGKELRNSSIIIGIILMITNLTLIPKYGETGAAYTKILAGVIYISLMLYYYIKVKNKIMRGTDVEK